MITTLSKHKYETLQILILILVTAILRLPIFLLSHNNNDELIHLSLAEKIENYGINVFGKKEYNLFYIERAFDPNNQLIAIFEGENKIGSLLEGFLGEREELSHHPPALPFFIAVSHALLSRTPVYLASISNNVYLMFRNLSVQFYACIVQFLFSLLLILSVYLLGRLFFSHKIGLLSALFLSLTPTALLTANKIWADDMTAFFAMLAVILHLYSLKDDKPVFSLLAGLSCGVAILAKMIAIYIVFTVLLFHVFENRNNKVSYKNIKDFIFDKKILYFLAGVFIASAWWFDMYFTAFSPKYYKGYFQVVETWDTAKIWNRYFSVVSNRPWYSYFILIPFQFPLYLLSYAFIPLFVLKNKIKSLQGLINKKERYLKFLIIWIIVAFTFLSLKPGKELRYMLIAYPAISLLSAYCLKLFYEWLKSKNFGIDLGLVRLLFMSMIFACLIYSLKIALPRVLFRADIIPIPL